MFQMSRKAEKKKEVGAWGRGGSVVSSSSQPRHTTPDSIWLSPTIPLHLPRKKTCHCIRFLSALLRHPESRGGECPIYHQDLEECFKTIFLSPNEFPILPQHPTNFQPKCCSSEFQMALAVSGTGALPSFVSISVCLQIRLADFFL